MVWTARLEDGPLLRLPLYRKTHPNTFRLLLTVAPEVFAKVMARGLRASDETACRVPRQPALTVRLLRALMRIHQQLANLAI